MKKAHKPIIFLAISMLVFACKEQKEEAPQCGFDILGMQTEMHSLGEERFQIALDAVDSSKSSSLKFFQNMSMENLEQLQNDLHNSYMAYQEISNLDIEASYELRQTNHFSLWLNSFPAGIDSINAMLSREEYQISESASSLVTGYPALEYLLFGIAGNQNEILSFYQNKAAVVTLVLNILDFNKGFIQEAKENWDNKKDAFASNSGNSNGDPLSLLVNALIKDFEYLKNFKLKNPAGRFNAGIPRPEFAEGKYSRKTFDLAYGNYQAFREFINAANGEMAIPLINYVSCLDQDLADRISLQFETVDQLWISLEAHKEDIFSTAASDILNGLINEMQKLTPLLKAEMTSKLNVSITFQDNDGD